MKLELLFPVCQGSEDSCTPGAEPRPPPRYKRKVKMRGIENLNLDNINTDTAGAAGAAGAAAAAGMEAAGAAVLRPENRSSEAAAGAAAGAGTEEAELKSANKSC